MSQFFSRLPIALSVHCFWLGAIAFLSLPYLTFYEQNLFSVSEPFFGAPLPTQTNKMAIRKDAFGEGDFGAKRSGGRKHSGIDIKAPVGHPVLASKSGRVSVVGWDKTGYGNYLELNHPDGLMTRYAHLSQVNVVDGQWVTQGEIIGKVGNTGNASHPRMIAHLHYEIRFKHHALDPLKKLMDPSIIIQT